ncbi:trifunctional histidinol dehydrogenase [Malassezia sp. CBS 17886]|nr:trifunctional histidinol dehydrogenase [Malassezia sp. CBS 17886]
MLQQTTPLLPYLATAPAGVGAWMQSPLGTAVALSAPLLVSQAALGEDNARVLRSAPLLVELEADATSDDAVALLNAGVEAVVAARGAVLIAGLEPQVVADRVVVAVAADEANAPCAAEYAGVLIRDAPADVSVQRFVDAMQTSVSGKPVYVSSAAAPSVERAAAAARDGAALVVRTDALTTDGRGVDYVDALLCMLVSDRSDGLFPTLVVSDTCSASLGLVYSSRASIRASLLTGSAHYESRKRGLWHKGATSGATQRVVGIRLDCDQDAVQFRVEQHAGTQSLGFCHLTARESCFGSVGGLAKLERTLRARMGSAPPGSYTARLFSDAGLLGAKIREEAQELVDATEQDHVAFEAADLLYFALAKCIAAGVGLADVERSLDAKSKKVVRRKGDAKEEYMAVAPGPDVGAEGAGLPSAPRCATRKPLPPAPPPASPPPSLPTHEDAPIRLRTYRLEETTEAQQADLLRRPGMRTEEVLSRVRPILAAVRERGDVALGEYTAQLDRVTLASNMRTPPFQSDVERAAMSPQVKAAIDVAYGNILRFHEAQNTVADAVSAPAGTPSDAWGRGKGTMDVQTMPGVVCSRFARAITRVGIYVPGGSAVLPSTALMLGVPAQVAGCATIVLATPPRADGSIAPEVLYVADKVGVSCIVCAGGAQAVAAMAYGTASVPKVDKIAGPGNQYVTAAKMAVQNDVNAQVSIDMPAGPSEVLVVADGGANPAFVASDLLSQAEHGPDSQVVLVGIALSDAQLDAVNAELERQARALPRVDVVRQAIDKSITMRVRTREDAITWSNRYAPEHLILHTEAPDALVPLVENAGSVFVGPWSPESCGDYASGTNHTLPTYGYARQYSGVSTSTFQKHITAQRIDAAGLRALGPHVVALAECEGLEAHANAVRVRLAEL